MQIETVANDTTPRLKWTHIAVCASLCSITWFSIALGLSIAFPIAYLNRNTTVQYVHVPGRTVYVGKRAPHVLIVYAGKTANGATHQLAESIREGALNVVDAPQHVQLVHAADELKHVTRAQQNVRDATAILLGSGVYNGNVEPMMAQYIDTVWQAGFNQTSRDPLQLVSKVGGAFATMHGYTTGAQPVLESIGRYLQTFGAVFVGGSSWHTSQGVAGVWNVKTGDWQSPYTADNAQDLGERVARLSTMIIGGDDFQAMTVADYPI